MQANVDSCLSERHLLAFARIIRSFARYEHVIDEAARSLAGTDAACFSLLTRAYDFRAKRLMLLDVLRQVDYPLDRYDRISARLMVPFTYSMLLHDIVHSEWIPHASNGGIQPAWIFNLAPTVMPLRDWGDASVEAPPRRAPDEHAYSVQDLENIADSLAAGHLAFSEYLRDIGLLSNGPGQTVN